jgi:uncharacterized membrane protein (Fun14 family)
MAAVQVFIDDAVRGRLPDVCVKDGVPARGSRVRMTREIGRSNRLGILWLLIFLGPIGWIVLLFLAAGDRGEQLTVTLPLSSAAHDLQVAATRRRNLGVTSSLGAGVILLLVAGYGGLDELRAVVAIAGVTMLALAVALAIVGEVRIEQTTVGIDLDASRRWLTITRVHPDFAAACVAHEAEQAATRRT